MITCKMTTFFFHEVKEDIINQSNSCQQNTTCYGGRQATYLWSDTGIIGKQCKAQQIPFS